MQCELKSELERERRNVNRRPASVADNGVRGDEGADRGNEGEGYLIGGMLGTVRVSGTSNKEFWRNHQYSALFFRR